MTQALLGQVALVAGATRGAGRGIACMLGEAGATVYCTGRSSRAAARPTVHAVGLAAFGMDRRPETIEETAERVSAAGGVGRALVVDHTDETAVRALFEQVRAEQGRLDILVNDVWGGDELAEWGKPFWEQDLQKGWRMQERAVYSHILTSHYAIPLMLAARRGLIIEITDGVTADYRGNFFYDLAKTSVIRLAYAMAQELAPHGLTALALTPGFLRSEAMLDHFGVTEANWQEAVRQEAHFIASETPYYVGRAAAALAADPKVAQKNGLALSSWELMHEYGFHDIDGRQPDWGRYFAEHVAAKA